MKSFNGDKKLKLLIQKEIEWHAKQDKLAQGAYSEAGKFCAVGCAIESTNKKLGTDYRHGDHGALEQQFDIPRILWRLEDRIFEGLSKEDAMKWPLQFWRALPVGVDLSGIWDEFIVWLLGDKKDGVIQYTKTDQQKKVIQNVIDLYKRKIKGENITQKEWSSAAASAAADASTASAAADASTASTAYAYAAAYADAAYAAAYADAAYAAAAAYAYASTAYASTASTAAAYADAAYAAAAAYAYASTDAAYAAAAYADAAYAAAAARQKHYKKMADKLLELLEQ